MMITRRTRSITRYLRSMSANSEFWLGVPAESHRDSLARLGFSIPFEIGEQVLPSAEFGPACRRNAEGQTVVHRDKPKETAYRQAEWHWEEFRGPYETVAQSRIVDVPYQRYPRTQLPPFAVEISIKRDISDVVQAVCGPFAHSPADDQRSTNSAKMLVELFGECRILSGKLVPWVSAPIRHLNWELLPPGKHPWKSAMSALEKVIKKSKEGSQPVIRARYEAIGRHGPEFVAVGKGGFDGYVVFGFPTLGLCMLESRTINNATYVLNESSWEAVSRMSKAEILSSGCHRARLIHREDWFTRVDGILDLSRPNHLERHRGKSRARE